MSIHCSFTVAWDICGQLPAVRQSGPRFPESLRGRGRRRSCRRHRDGVDSDTASGKLWRASQKSGSNCIFLCSVQMQSCWPVSPPRCENNKLPSTWSCFFTLYILSIFTHKMYMIGMHIIFLLTDSFNKALCQSAAIVSTFCSLCGPPWTFSSV